MQRRIAQIVTQFKATGSAAFSKAATSIKNAITAIGPAAKAAAGQLGRITLAAGAAGAALAALGKTSILMFAHSSIEDTVEDLKALRQTAALLRISVCGMTTIISLDLATNAGFCVLTDGAVVEVGSWPLAEGIPGPDMARPAGHGLKCHRLHRELLALACRRAPVALIAVEADFGRGLGSVVLRRLQGIAHVVAIEVGAIPLEVGLSDWREDGVDAQDADAAEAYCIGRFVADRAVFHHRVAGRRRRAA